MTDEMTAIRELTEAKTSAGTRSLGDDGAQVAVLPLGGIKESPYQPRQGRVTKGDVEELMASIASVGQTSPILVTREDDHYVVHSGHRRCAAMRYLGHETVRAVILDGVEERQLRRLAVADNLGRDDLTAFEQVEALDDYRERYGLEVDAAARELGVAARTAQRLAAIGRASPVLKAALRRHAIAPRPASALATIEQHGSTRRACELTERLAAGKTSSASVEDIAARARAKARGGGKGATAAATATRQIIDLKTHEGRVTLRVDLPLDGDGAVLPQHRERLEETLASMLGHVGISRVDARDGGRQEAV